MTKIYKHSTRRMFSPKYFLTWPSFLIIWIIAQLPYDRLISLGKLIGLFVYKCFPERKHIIRTNLTLCFPDKTSNEIEFLVKENLKFLGIGICETALAWFGSSRIIDILSKKLTIENETTLKHLLNDDKPLLIITPHASSQELVSKVLIQKYEFSPVFRHMNNPIVNYFMQKARLKIYKNPILKSNTRQIIRALNSKTAVGILPDQDFGRRRSVFVPFFGVTAATSTSLSKYKKLTNANIIALSYLRDKNDYTKFTITVSEPLAITGSDLEHDATLFNQEFEKIISKDIPMYFWIARRFKTRPLGLPSVYKK